MFALRLTIYFVAIGVLASLAVLVLTLRGRHLRRVLERRAEQEIALSTLARALSGALAVPDVAGLTVDAAIQLSRVGGAYLAATHDKRLVVLAARGTSESKAGKSLVVPSWLGDRGKRDQPRLFTAETRPRRDDHNGRPRREISSQLLVPMYHDGAIIGLLTLTAADGRRTFSDSVARYGRALGDLAAVAMHRAETLQRERDARAQAEDAVRTRERVVSIVSHDLRNPLTAILGGADFLLEIIPDDEHRAAVREQLQRMRHAATTMNRLIVDLLDIARLESGPLPMHFKELNLVQVIDSAFDLFESSAHQHEIRLERPAAAEVPTVWGDPDRLVQMLSNLLGNALKFTPKGGSVGVRVARDAKQGVELTVHDTGPGIPPERLQHLFDRFWHVTNGHSNGLGLGLSIVRAIAEAHGSTIHIESTTEAGTTVRIVLPLAAGHEQWTRLRLESSVGSGEAAKAVREPAGGQTQVAGDD
jgi:signal transduction histidine kinase